LADWRRRRRRRRQRQRKQNYGGSGGGSGGDGSGDSNSSYGSDSDGSDSDGTKGPILHTIHPLRIRPSLLRLDTLPFFLLYTLFIYIDVTQEELRHHINICFPLTLVIHIGLFLATRWSVPIRRELCCFTSATKRSYKEWTAKFAAVMEKLRTLEEASLSQNLPPLS